MEPYPKIFGARLRRLIDEKGITIVQFGREFPLSEANVHNWLKKEAPPLQKYWQRLADYFECPVDTIVHGAPRNSAAGSTKFGAVGEAPAIYGLKVLPSPADLKGECRAIFEKLLELTGTEMERAAWLREQLRAIVPPRHWLTEDKWDARLDRMFEDMRGPVDTEGRNVRRQ